jgi:hypothetical protein
MEKDLLLVMILKLNGLESEFPPIIHFNAITLVVIICWHLVPIVNWNKNLK